MTRADGRRCAGLSLLLALTSCANAPSIRDARTGVSGPTDTSTAFLEVPAVLESDVRLAESVGKIIYEYDRAAEKTTDELFPDLRPTHPNGTIALGWLVAALGDGTFRVSYVADSNGAFIAYAQADYSAGGDKVSNAHLVEPPRPLSAVETAQVRAIRTASASEFLRCAETYNFVSIAASDSPSSTIHVYLIPSRTDLNSFPQGGFHDFSISVDGTSILNHFRQTKACINGSVDASKGQLSSLMSTHITSTAPTPFHVFMSLNYRLPIYTVTVQNHMLWYVREGSVRLVSNDVRKK